MKIQLNGAWRELTASPQTAAAPTLTAMLRVCGYGGATVATAVNGEFVPARARDELHLQDGDRVEVLAPMQGG
ncbi:MAG TPA: sulfur carrier protein ThiS [Steroidobacteraceae bacterium]|jgi:sulfur carrier protein|nr:sulfur carrier protein ThiS [Steroidobacteraceae bacterium]